MPKSTSLSPSNIHAQQKPTPDDRSSRISDVALRKKKNADAQAAFRARRANYIATLEETVTSLESVVLQLQESCREARNEAQELRQESARVRHEYRERERFWRGLWQARKTDQGLEPDDLPPLPASFSSGYSNENNISSHSTGTPQVLHFASNNNMERLRSEETYDASAPGHGYSTSPSPVLAYPLPNDVSGQRVATKYSPYTYPTHASSRDTRWQGPSMTRNSACSGEADSGGVTSVQPPQLPGYADSASSNVGYATRFSADEQKAPIDVLDNAPYVFPGSIPHSRSMSPNASTQASTSSTSVPPFQFTFPGDSGANPAEEERNDYDFQRHVGLGVEMTLHGGSADVSIPASGSSSLHYRFNSDKMDSNQDQTAPLPPLSGSENDERESSDASDVRLRSRRNTLPCQSPRSPSPGASPVSCTVAVIKAQAFGALRRTRARSNKSSEGAARVAMDVLEARGIGATGTKRQRLQDYELEAA